MEARDGEAISPAMEEAKTISRPNKRKARERESPKNENVGGNIFGLKMKQRQ